MNYQATFLFKRYRIRFSLNNEMFKVMQIKKKPIQRKIILKQNEEIEFALMF